MPLRDWKPALNRFSIQFEERMPQQWLTDVYTKFRTRPNPVKHGYVTHATEWPHSSIHKYIKEGKLANDWSGDKNVELTYGRE
jgi:hypothetical protein